jgi:hypothetical protein
MRLQACVLMSNHYHKSDANLVSAHIRAYLLFLGRSMLITATDRRRTATFVRGLVTTSDFRLPTSDFLLLSPYIAHSGSNG